MTVTRAPLRNSDLAMYSIVVTGNAYLKRNVLNYHEKRIWCEVWYDRDFRQFRFAVHCGLSPRKHYVVSSIDPQEFFFENLDKRVLIQELTASSAKKLGYILKEKSDRKS